MPDGVTTVSFRAVDGTTSSVTVKENVYHAPADAVAARFVVDGVQREIELVSKDAFVKAFPGQRLQPSP